MTLYESWRDREDPETYAAWLDSEAYDAWTYLSEPTADLNVSERKAFLAWLDSFHDDDAA